MLVVVCEVWEYQGYWVYGVVFFGKVVEGLEESFGIESCMFVFWFCSWENDCLRIGQGDVFVIDEVGMVGSWQFVSFIIEVEQCGVKIVLVGDYEQLQVIGVGVLF